MSNISYYQTQSSLSVALGNICSVCKYFSNAFHFKMIALQIQEIIIQIVNNLVFLFFHISQMLLLDNTTLRAVSNSDNVIKCLKVIHILRYMHLPFVTSGNVVCLRT